ncbi:hemolysin [Bifidobacterium goeldii]|uniref:Hemolysin n=1 Tax=Bifidobacterium goeldii TaxID=2306975 RepID=A0A430FNB2_9BIFI|nr:YggT family protein [Bifidobacterium goeldii]RSX54311.1 hemolysin [Bifidobacterium goeldii]
MLFYIVHSIVDWAIGAYITVLFIRMILDWVAVLVPRWYPRGVVAALINVVYQITEPPLRWLRRYIRPIPLGPGMSLDTSFIVLYFILIVLQILL